MPCLTEIWAARRRAFNPKGPSGTKNSGTSLRNIMDTNFRPGKHSVKLHCSTRVVCTARASEPAPKFYICGRCVLTYLKERTQLGLRISVVHVENAEKTNPRAKPVFARSVSQRAGRRFPCELQS